MKGETPSRHGHGEKEQPTAGDQENSPVFPHEILLLILDQLERVGEKRTISRVMRASKDFYALGLPVLLKNMDFSAWGPFFTSKTDNYKLKDFLRCCREKKLFCYFKQLRIEHGLYGISCISILKECWNTLEQLQISWQDYRQSTAVWNALAGFQRLHSLRVGLFGNSAHGFNQPLSLPPSVKSLTLDAGYPAHWTVAAFVPLLEDTATQLDHIDMDMYMDQDLDLDNVPNICRKIRSICLVPLDLSYLLDLKNLDQLRSINVWKEGKSYGNKDWCQTNNKLSTVERVSYDHFNTDCFPDLLRVFPNLKTLELNDPQFQMPLAKFDDIEKLVKSSQLERIELSWNFDDVRVKTDGCAEKVFWKSLAIVHELIDSDDD